MFMVSAGASDHALPAGSADVTFRVAGSTERLDIKQQDFPTPPHGTTNRTTGTAAISVDVPISHRGKSISALGNLTLNGDARIEELSDRGALERFGAGLNWSPIERLNLIAGWDREEDAPTVRQLGDPFVQTPGTRIFDFTNGVVPRAAVVTGGNPDLRSDRRNTFKLSANWQPLDQVNLRLRADYARVMADRPISDITVSPELEAAFPDRLVRGPAGNLLSVDLRPVNFDHARRDTLQVGFDFLRLIFPGESEAMRQPGDVGVHNNTIVDIEGVSQDDVCCLAADTAQLNSISRMHLTSLSGVT